MITSDRQFKITSQEASKMEEALNQFVLRLSEKKDVDPRLIAAQRDSLLSQLESLREELHEYERIKSGKEHYAELSDLSDLPRLLIKSRIAQGLSQTALANKLEMKPQQIQRYEAEEYSSANIDRLIDIANALGVSIKDGALVAIKESSSEDRSWSKFPIKEMYKRGWFLGFEGSYKQLLENADELMGNFFAPFGVGAPAAVFHKKTSYAGNTADPYALKAWHTRVVHEALQQSVKTAFNPQANFDAWVKRLVRMSVENNAPALVADHLAQVGIHFVIEPHLPGTYLDGAALTLPNGNPLIAMTLRHDRLDNFWFALLHEVGHIIKHIAAGKASAFYDDLDADDDGDNKMEQEANSFASESLISSEVWKKSLVRYFSTPEAINEQAIEWGIHPSIIAGRIRQEQENWLILNDLIGIGKVRTCFIDQEVKYE